KNGPRPAFWGIAAATLLLLGTQAVRGQSFPSPVGFWDVVETGGRSGVAAMRFLPDSTISIDEIVVPKAARNSNSSIGRNSGDVGRTGGGGNGGTNSLPAHTNLFGSVIFPAADITNAVDNILVQMTTNLDV